MTFDGLRRRAASLGLAVRGGFHPQPGEFDRLLPEARTATMILLGFTGGEQWGCYQSSAEAGDGLPHPLDRWSRRVIGALAEEFGGLGLYADGAPPPAAIPAPRIAQRAGAPESDRPAHPSRVGAVARLPRRACAARPDRAADLGAVGSSLLELRAQTVL